MYLYKSPFLVEQARRRAEEKRREDLLFVVLFVFPITVGAVACGVRLSIIYITAL